LKVNFGELLTKQALRKNVLYTKSTYILKLLLKAVTAGIEALVSGDKFLYACVKRVPPVSSATFRHLPSTPNYY
jgi:hypothetical protein